ncbi:MAG: hypothetical protein Q7O66_10400 [Dehalococcoidia bacterium]|nr:hypothetical protein [Dehalococcoidia bacterium]
MVAWDCAAANVADNTFQPVVRQFEDQMIVFSDTGFHSKEGDPPNLKVCQRHQWNPSEKDMLIETVLLMQTVINHFKKVGHRVWEYFQMRLAFTLAAFNVLAQWHGLPARGDGFVALSIAEFSL